ncbi:MAG: 50S ribosomal protein L24e [Thermoplasmatota archaeon]
MNCTFCGSPIEAGTGKMYIRRDATVFHFCSSKCQHNQVDLGRVNRHVRWTQAAEEHKGERVQGNVRAGAGAAAKPKATKAAAPTAAKAPKKEAKAPAK